MGAFVGLDPAAYVTVMVNLASAMASAPAGSVTVNRNQSTPLKFASGTYWNTLPPTGVTAPWLGATVTELATGRVRRSYRAVAPDWEKLIRQLASNVRNEGRTPSPDASDDALFASLVFCPLVDFPAVLLFPRKRVLFLLTRATPRLPFRRAGPV